MNWLAALVFLGLPIPGEDADLSRPVRSVVSRDATTVYVANAGSGTVTVLDAATGAVRSTHGVGRRLTDLATSATGRLFAVDTAAGEVLELRAEKGELRVAGRVSVPGCIRLALNAQGTAGLVTCRWARTAHVLQMQPLSVGPPVNLGFAPQEVAALDDDRFLVAAAFGGHLSVVELDGTHKDHVLRGHNIRGLIVRDEEVLIAHQVLSEIAHTEFADVHWGTLMQNVLSRAPIDQLGSDSVKFGRLAIGDVGRGSADPGSMTLLPDGRLAVVLSGSDEVLLSTIPDDTGRFRFAGGTRFPTGARPVHVTASRDGNLFVADSLGDSLTIVKSDGETVTVGGVDETKLTAEQRGERAFFSGRLSHDGWLSCHSCHSEGHRTDLKADTLGDGTFGNPKVIPSLLGVADTAPWGWSGGFDRLEEQISKSVRTTMHGEPEEAVVADLVAYLKTLAPPPRLVVADDQIASGQAVFRSQGCTQCHAEHFTSDQTYDVGFKDEAGQTRFNPPSLRGLRQRRAYFHDGRATTLSEAIDLHSRGLKKKLSAEEKQSLRRYLLSL